MRNLIFISTHPIQYFTPLYKELSKETDVNLRVLFCSDEMLKNTKDIEFGVEVKWDIPLVEGYAHEFIHNNSWKPSINNGFWGLLNLGIIRTLRKSPPSYVVVQGWNNASYIISLVFAKLFGHKVCLRVETPWHQELKKNKYLVFVKRYVLKTIFTFIDYGFYIGNQNRLFYENYNFSPDQLIFTPYSIDNDRFSSFYRRYKKNEARMLLNLEINASIVLFSAKYIEKKRPLDLLRALQLITNPSIKIVFVGEGNLRSEMENFVDKYQLQDRVLFTGFVNQSQIPLYYASADCFVMCSGLGETWGLSVNEALNFNIPLVISDTCGCSFDLVSNGVNGFVFKEGDIEDLKNKIELVITNKALNFEELQKLNTSLLNTYSYKTILDNLRVLPKN